MSMVMLKCRSICLLVLVFFISCKKTETKNFENNTPVSPHRISTIKIEGYVNRLFIDLVGRSPLDAELATETDVLKAANLSKASRENLVTKLQSDSTPVEGDSSYKIAYYERLYIIIKSKLVEGVDDSEFTSLVNMSTNDIVQARLLGDSIRVMRALDQVKRHQDVVDAKFQLRKGQISLNDVFARLLNNSIYDQINMNTFNFVNATFDDLFYRFPTQAEFDVGFKIIEKNEIGGLFGGFASTKGEYCTLLTESDEFYEGLIRWTYLTLLGREPSTQEVVNHFATLRSTKDFQAFQKAILITDEYADFI